MNSKVLLLLIGLFVGAVSGYVTRPVTTEITLGPLSIEVKGNRTARGGTAELTSSQWRHIAIFTAIGGVIGLGAGFAIGRRS